MTTTRDRTTKLAPRPITAHPFPVHEASKGSMLGQLLGTTDHKMIGRRYLVTAMAFFHDRRRDASMLPFLYKHHRYGELVTADDPRGHYNCLEWVTSSPPPRHNFTFIARIRSERPAFEYHYPRLRERLESEAHAGRARPRTGVLAGITHRATARRDSEPVHAAPEESRSDSDTDTVNGSYE
jgi:heme/copper-type cytochrome/quinol oxidase subunit 1